MTGPADSRPNAGLGPFPSDGVWRCEGCGEIPDNTSTRWRWAGSHWEHHHGYPVGHVTARYFGPAGSTCTWTQRPYDVDDNIWTTACGHTWQFTHDGPAENGCRFCCYCGGALIPVIAGEPDDDTEEA